MVSGPHSSKMALGGLFSISRENSSEIFEMLLPKSYCREYADIDPTCQISIFQPLKIDWANLANRRSKRTLIEFNSLEKFFTKNMYVYRLWQVPGNFNCSVPRSVGLTGIFAEKVPNIASIKGTAIQYIQYTYKTL